MQSNAKKTHLKLSENALSFHNWKMHVKYNQESISFYTMIMKQFEEEKSFPYKCNQSVSKFATVFHFS